jgi:O-antigen/teichoic acid export membrane protein
MLNKNAAEVSSESVGMVGQCVAPTQVDIELANTNTFVGDANRQDAGWDLLQAPKNYLALLSAQLTGSLLSFASVWLVTRYLGAGGYGGVVALIAAAQIVMLLAVNWTSIAVARHGVEEFVQTGRIAATFWARLAILIPNVLLVIATIPLWLPRLSDLLHLPSNAVWLVLCLFLINAGWIHVQQALQGAKLLRLQGWLLTLERVLIFVAICALALRGGLSVWSMGWVYVLGPLGASLAGLFRLRKLIWPTGRLDLLLLKRMLRFSLPIIPTAFIGYLSTNYLDALFISHFLSHVELGVYAVAYQVAGLSQQIPLLAGSLLMPLFVTLQVGKREDRMVRFIRGVLPLLTLLWTIACALVAAVGWYLLPFLFGAKFQQTGALLWPLMAAGALAGPVLMGYAPVTTSTSNTHVPMLGVTLASFANVILDFLLIPRFGLLGCAWATTAAYGINLVIVFFFIHWRIVPSRTWTLQATLPVVLGALYASLFQENLGAVGLALLASALIAMAHRKSIATAVTTLSEYGHFALFTRSESAGDML